MNACIGKTVTDCDISSAARDYLTTDGAGIPSAAV